MRPDPKPIRDKTPEYLEFVRQQKCCVCDFKPPEPHHVRSRGAGGGDIGNVIPFCRYCHILAHSGHIAKVWQREQADIYLKRWEDKQ